MFRKFYISNRLSNRYFPKIDAGCPWNNWQLAYVTLFVDHALAPYALGRNAWRTVSKGYRPEASWGLCDLFPSCALGQRTRGTNPITTSWRPTNGLFLHWRRFLKGCSNTLTKNVSYCSSFFCFLTLLAGTGGIDRFLGFLIMLVFQSRISN